MKMSNWTVETLKEHFEGILAEKDKAINIALAAAKEAVLVAESNAEKWRSNANEWRGAMSDREKTFVSRAEFDAYRGSVEKALSVEKERGDVNQGRGLGAGALWGYIVGAIGLAVTVISFLTR